MKWALAFLAGAVTVWWVMNRADQAPVADYDPLGLDPGDLPSRLGEVPRVTLMCLWCMGDALTIERSKIPDDVAAQRCGTCGQFVQYVSRAPKGRGWTIS